MPALSVPGSIGKKTEKLKEKERGEVGEDREKGKRKKRKKLLLLFKRLKD